MKRIVAFILSLILVISLAACASNTPSNATPGPQETTLQTDATLVQNSEEALPASDTIDESEESIDADISETLSEENSEDNTEVIPGLAGSSAFDMWIAMNSLNFPVHSKQNLYDGAYGYYSSMTEDTLNCLLTYDIFCNENDEITSAIYTVSNSFEYPAFLEGQETELFTSLAASYLGFCSTTFYGNCDIDAARAWVEEVVPTASLEPATIIIGDAEFEITGFYNEDLQQYVDMQLIIRLAEE